MKFFVTIAVLTLALLTPAAAQTITLDLINEYPATSISGEADAFFASAVKRKTEGRVVIRPIPDAKSGLRSRDQLKAVSEGRFAMANTVGGTLGEPSRSTNSCSPSANRSCSTSCPGRHPASGRRRRFATSKP